MEKGPLTMITFRPSVISDFRIPILEAAEWLHEMGLLVPTTVTLHCGLASYGRYNFIRNLIKINPLKHQGTGMSEFQATFVHEAVHAWQGARGAKTVKTVEHNGTAKTKTDLYYLKPREVEAFWWENEYLKSVHSRESFVVRTYRRLGVKEFA